MSLSDFCCHPSNEKHLAIRVIQKVSNRPIDLMSIPFHYKFPNPNRAVIFLHQCRCLTRRAFLWLRGSNSNLILNAPLGGPLNLGSGSNFFPAFWRVLETPKILPNVVDITPQWPKKDMKIEIHHKSHKSPTLSKNAIPLALPNCICFAETTFWGIHICLSRINASGTQTREKSYPPITGIKFEWGAW